MIPGLMNRTPAEFSSFRAFVFAGAPLPSKLESIENLMAAGYKLSMEPPMAALTMTRLTDPEHQRLYCGQVVPDLSVSCAIRVERKFALANRARFTGGDPTNPGLS
jgi:hypothetical protein